MLIYSVHATFIACLSVQGDGSLLCCSFWGFFHCFPVKVFFFGEFCHLRVWEQRVQHTVQTVKPLEVNIEVNLWFVILAYINETDLTWKIRVPPSRFYHLKLLFYPPVLCHILPIAQTSVCILYSHPHQTIFISYFFIYIYLFIFSHQHPDYANTFHCLWQFGCSLSSFPKMNI